MPRYASRPRADWDDDQPLIVNPTVYEQEPVFTGLLDAEGNPLFRFSDPIGFHHPMADQA